ncbi:MAG: AMP-binding protein [Clostridiales bacterium]|nr:AMP-binding protein [Clostridiales bacterium]
MELIQTYIKNIPFYAKKSVYTQGEFASFPVLTKQEIIDNYKDFDIKSNHVLTTRTSGSSGLILSICWNDFEYLHSLSRLWKIRGKYGITPSDPFCTLHVNYNVLGRISNAKIIANRNQLSFSKAYTDDKTLKAYFSTIHDFKPTWLLVQPSFLYTFAAFLDKIGVMLPDSVKLIELNGEHCSQSMIDYFKIHYPNIQITNMYGMQECNGIAYGESEFLQILEDNVYVEVLDQHSLPCPEGNEGDIVITTLTNSIMPLIRYKTGDRGIINQNGLLKITQSRCNDSVMINNVSYDGSVFWNIIDNVNSVYCNRAIRQFKTVLQNGVFHFQLVMDSQEFSEDYLVKCISDTIHTLFDWPPVDVTVTIVDLIKEDRSSNKIKYFINMDQ